MTFKTSTGTPQVPPKEESKPNAEQQAVIDAVDGGRNVLITGNAGSGKSFVVGKLKDKYGYEIAITSTTGVAALLIGGNTIHSWAGIGLGEGTPGQIAKKINDRGGRTLERIVNCERLVIDEVSMLSAELFTKLDHVFRMVRETETPFGNIQMIIVGDFLQLPAVHKFVPQPFDAQEEMMEQEEVGRYPFDSKSWAEAEIQTHELKTIVRQKDKVFAEVLNKVRLGIVDEQVRSVLVSRMGRFVDDGSGVKPVRVFSTNASVDAINLSELNKVDGPEKVFTAKYTGMPWAIENIKKNCLAVENIRLKVGAQVMLLRNVNIDAGLVNGSLGVVKNFAHGIPQVEFSNGVVHACEPEVWEIKDGDRSLASCEQVPLRLAYAATIHKLQGATLDKVELDLGNCFEYGQAYVALSRCRTLDGMFITQFVPSKIKACPRAKAFYGHK